MAERRSLAKRLLILAGLLAAGVVIAVAISAYLYKAAPDFYAQISLSPEELDNYARAVEQKLAAAQNWASETRANEQRRLRGTTTTAIGGTTVSFSDAELNAFFQKWQAMIGWDQKYGQYLTNPTITLQDGRVILAGTVTELGTVASLHFTPTLDAQGQLQLRLERVMAGRLPMPDALWTSQKDRVASALSRNLPEWQRKAKMDAGGSTNGAAVQAAMTKLLLNVLQGKPGDPVIFMPVDDRGSIPTRVTAVTVKDRKITMSVDPMNADERAEFLKRVKMPAGTETAAAVR